MISRLLCAVLVMSMAGPGFGQAPTPASPATSVQPADLEAYGLTVAANLQVTNVEPGTAADEIGLKTGDSIRDLNGRGFGSPDRFARALRAIPAGRVVRIGVSRSGEQIVLAGHVDQAASGAVTVRGASQTVVKGCTSWGSGYDPCCPGGPGSQYWVGNCPLHLDLSDCIGLCDPCNRCPGSGGCGSGCGCR
ncbi:hypothetical protein Pan44_40580 [Caulifigura coniformis]|uniref:PDZ domain-containing protein n=1 Tax=Caulifigura coniformis TaxID=2527983 RepID=A0A517SIT1_9PLAN|nr:PDZ domain-containing protein [Caulifigura coniformis]QDT56009.1 hypothetical protein Pan44_40580 [Caulifigura coniformis]